MKQTGWTIAVGACAVIMGCGGGDGAGNDGGGGADGGAAADAASAADAMYDATPSLDAGEMCVGGSSSAKKLVAPTITMAGGVPRLEHSALLPGPVPPCNPVAQTGCQAGEKCTQLVESDDPFIANTTCVPDGAVPVGGSCTEGTPGPDTGYDDCVAGTLCTGGVCLEICTQAPDSCPMGSSCVSYANTFDDLEGIGMCNPECNVIDQDCCNDPGDPFGTGCYVSMLTGSATCAPALSETTNGTPGVQGDACMYLNTCAVGFGCTQLDDPVTANGNVCAKFCDPTMMGGPGCDDTGSATTCVIINGGFYGDATNLSMDIGFCVDCTVWTDVPGCSTM